MALEREQYDLNKQQREEYYRLESENLERKITEYQQQWDLQERIIATQRESQDKQLEWQQRSLELQQKAYEIQQQLEIITTKTTQTYSDMANQADMFSKYGENFNLVMESLKGLMQESNIASSTNIFALTDFIKAINSLNPSVIDHLLNAAGY